MWVLFFTMGGATSAQADTHQRYFPLNVGNSWTYINSGDASTKTFAIIGTEEINGYTYYKFDDYVRVCGFPGGSEYPDDDILFRYDPDSDKVLQYCSSTSEDLVRFDFSGDMFGEYGCQMIETNISCTTPAGEFHNCSKFEFAMTVDCGEFFETLAPGLGNVEFIEFSSSQGHFKLQDYTGGWVPEDIEIVPENPTSADVVDITFSGNWPDSCIPTGSNVRVDGSDIYFEVFEDTSGACWAVITPWEQTQSVGPLSPGRYTVYAALANPMEAVMPQYTQVARFNVADPNLVGWWEFEGDANDSSGNNNHGSFVGDAHIISDPCMGSVLGVDGSGDSVDIPQDPSLNFTNHSFTVAAWVNPNVKDQHIFAHYEYSSENKALYIKIDDNGKVTFGFYFDDLNTAAGVIQFRSWNHVVCTYDYDSDTSTVYVDRNPVATGSNGPYTGSNVTSWIGGSGPGGDFDFDGGIDDVRIYNRALSAIEIQQIYGRVEAFSPDPADEAPGINPNTDLSWTPYYAATSQEVFLGTVSGSLSLVASGDGSLNSVSNAQIGGPLDFAETYYWRVDTDGVTGVEWDFDTCRLPGVIYVDTDRPLGGNGTSWSDAYKFLQDALDATYSSTKPVEIHVAQGTYKPDQDEDSDVISGNHEVSFQLINEVTLKGGYAGDGEPDPNERDVEAYETILSGDLAGDDGPDFANNGENSYHVTIGSGTDPNAVLDGFIITAGNADGYIPNNHGAGLYNRKGSPTLISCTFSNNSARNGGGMYNYDSNPTLVNCTFSANHSDNEGGGIYNYFSIPTLTNCVFDKNLAKRGGGMHNGRHSNSSLTNCRFIENSAVTRGGGMQNLGSNSPMLNDCSFIGNQAENGGGICNYGFDNYRPSPTLTNCVFRSNSADLGGAILNRDNTRPVFTNCTFSGNLAIDGAGMYSYATYAHYDTRPKLINCSFFGNSATNHGGGMYSGNAMGIVTNCIFWGNTVDEIYIIGTKSPFISYSDIQNWFGGPGNINTDPLFIDANGVDDIVGTEDDDLRLLPGSPCIDAGDNTAIPPSVVSDLDGNARIINHIVDMGAYEFCLLVVDDDAPDDPGPNDPQVSDPQENGSEAHPFDSIQQALDAAGDGYTVRVRQGRYTEPDNADRIDFLDKNIVLTSSHPTDWDVVENTVIDGYVQFGGSEDPNCRLTGFRIHNIYLGAIYGNRTHATISHCNISGNGPCGAIAIRDCDGIISNCLITDNTTFLRCGVFPVVFGCNGLIKNCTIANNDSGLSVGTATIENCIIYNNMGSQLAVTDGESLNISYSNVQGGLEGIIGDGHVNWGPGNIDTDPCFVRSGYWIMGEETLIEGDYHLTSEGWRWNTEGKSWTYDYVTSRCIDAGNPCWPLDEELSWVPRDPDNVWGINRRINMGAFGGTAQAGIPPHNWMYPADLDNNGRVDCMDLADQTKAWLIRANWQPGDLNRDGVVDAADFAVLAEDWRQRSAWLE